MMKVGGNVSDMNMAQEGRSQFSLWWSPVTAETFLHKEDGRGFQEQCMIVLLEIIDIN